MNQINFRPSWAHKLVVQKSAMHLACSALSIGN